MTLCLRVEEGRSTPQRPHCSTIRHRHQLGVLVMRGRGPHHQVLGAYASSLRSGIGKIHKRHGQPRKGKCTWSLLRATQRRRMCTEDGKPSGSMPLGGRGPSRMKTRVFLARGPPRLRGCHEGWRSSLDIKESFSWVFRPKASTWHNPVLIGSLRMTLNMKTGGW